MKNIIKRESYVRYLCGSAGTEITRIVASRNAEAAVREGPVNAFVFRFFDITETRDGIVSTSSMDNRSVRHYIGGETYGVDEIADDQLRSSMLINGWDRIIRTPFGKLFPLRPEDLVLSRY